ncbi:MAG: type I glyceraldehyde-3-phosphate dehydrogenase [Patescibacteria group bacterium]
MTTKLAINGFGRIGRAAFKIALTKPDVEVAAINDLTDTATLAHLLQYDTVYGKYEKLVKSNGKSLVIDGKEYPVLAEKEPNKLPWKDLKIDVVIESTGRFVKQEQAASHLAAGAQRVVISAPAKGGGVDTFVLGVNDAKLKGQKIISNASCTTNCIAPVIEIVNRSFGIKKAMMTTIHSYTADQNLVDGPHKDLRRARAAAANIVPTSTGAAIATGETVPEVKGKFDGISIRVPTPIVSLSDITMVVGKPVTIDAVNAAFKAAKDEPRYQGVLDVTEEELVSSDFIGNSHASIVDLSLTNVVDGDLLKVVAWYDNEWGYSNTLVRICQSIGKKI